MELFAAFLERWHEGEETINELCAAHAEHAPFLRGCWDQLKTIGEVSDGRAATPSVSPGPHRIGPFEIVEEIGRGGQGVVYLAHDTRLDRRVALKILSGFDATSSALVERFRREAELTARLDHPAICPVYDAGAIDDVPYISMRFVEGQTLAEDIRSVAESTDADRHRAFRQDAVRLAEAVARAIHEAHEAQLLHRDIKPKNIMIDRHGQPMVLDFGLARDLDAQDATLTESGAVVGTPTYMAPEQLAPGRRSVDQRTDVFALGTTLFEWVTFRRAFEATTRDGLFRAILQDDPPDPRSLAPGLPRDLAVVIGTAMEKDPGRRYATALDLAEDLRRIRERRPILARPPTATQRLTKWATRHPALATLLGSTAAALCLVTVLLVDSMATRARLDERNAGYRRMADANRLRSLAAQAELFQPLEIDAADSMRRWLREARDLLSRRHTHRQTLLDLRRRALTSEPSWSFQDAEDAWEHDIISGLLSGIVDFSETEGSAVQRVERWIRFADGVRRRSLEDARDAWRRASASIADEQACPRYRGLKITPQVGLVPLGRDPASGLWEFAHLLSGPPPHRKADGSLVTTEESGMVLVLLPGGRFNMGAHPPNETRRIGDPNVDPAATPQEAPVHQVDIEPFFVARCEMTQAQWLRFAGRNPSALPPELATPAGRTTLRHPVENVSFLEASRILRGLGLALPTEEQWEYAARGATATVWFTGDARGSLEDYANLADRSSKRVVIKGFDNVERWDDEYVLTAPVGSFLPNEFGLHDMVGNVREWTGDRFVRYGSDPESAGRSMFRTIRGGSYADPAVWARSAFRTALNEDRADSKLGLRAVRPLISAERR